MGQEIVTRLLLLQTQILLPSWQLVSNLFRGPFETSDANLHILKIGAYYSQVCSKQITIMDFLFGLFDDHSVEDNEDVAVAMVIPLPAKPPS